MNQQREGQGTDGNASRGMVEEKTRPAGAGETDTTRFGMVEEGADTDGEGTGGMVDEQDSVGQTSGTPPSSDRGGGGGLASGLQQGGTIPGGGPGTSQGALGTGGGSNQNEDTGTLARWSDGEHEETGQ